jgi:hypothetical protein
MARRIAEPVVVRAEESGAPGTFLWRDRIYVVREVLGHWQERRSWWTTAAARAVHGDTAGDLEVKNESEDRMGDGAAPGYHDLDHEREVWRVEASAGRMFGNGVYDLAREGRAAARTGRSADELASRRATKHADVSAGSTRDSETGAVTAVAPPDHRWHLLRVAD